MIQASAPAALPAALRLYQHASALRQHYCTWISRFNFHQSPSDSSTSSSRTYSSAASPPQNAMALIKELRQMSGAPISDVKSCLAGANWDMTAAHEALRLKGLAAAVKKSSRHASEGLVAVAQSGNQQAAVVEINSETDFVGRSGPFQQLVTAAARAALSLIPSSAVAAAASGSPVQEVDYQQLAAARLPGGGSSVEEACAMLAGQVRENIALRRGFLVQAAQHGVVSSYVHMPVTAGAGRITAVVALQAKGPITQDVASELSQLGQHLAMHSAGMNTQYISQQHMPAAALAALRDDFLTQTEATMPNKPAEVLGKIVEGKVAKWCKESCLLEQKYVLDDTITVSQLLADTGKRLGLQGPVQVSGLLRVQVGEGLAAREDARPDFAAEVAAMAAGGQ